MKTKMTLIAMHLLLLTACGGGGGGDSDSGAGGGEVADPIADASAVAEPAGDDAVEAQPVTVASPYAGSYAGKITYTPVKTYKDGEVKKDPFKQKDVRVKISTAGYVSVLVGEEKGQASLVGNAFQMKVTGRSFPVGCTSGSTTATGKIAGDGKISGSWKAKFFCEDKLSSPTRTYTYEENGSLRSSKQ